jgi:two-component system sensor histidine kinase BaeS
MVAIAFGVLVLSAAATAVLYRQTSTNSAIHDLRRKAPGAANAIEKLDLFQRAANTNRPNRANGQFAKRLRNSIAATLRVSGASLVRISSSGQVLEGIGPFVGNANAAVLELPKGISPDDLNVDALLVGREQSGRRDRIVFVAEPLKPRTIQTATFTPVLVLTQEIESQPLGRVGPFFLLAGSLTFIVAAVVAFYLARRLTRRLAAMQDTAGRIAGGDLSARVDLGSNPDDELASLARSLDGMAAQLEAAQGMERDFLLSVSHDLRTPLTSIKGYAEALAEGAVDGHDAQRHAAQVIAAEARRLERLVADLLDLARLNAHEFSLTPQPVDACEVVTEAVDAFRPSAEELGVDLRISANGPVPADADPERLGQIVANLVENALKYARGQVTVGVVQTNGLIELRIDDDGPGIDPSELSRVFERLYMSRTAPGRRVGTGLGLAIVRELAAAMGGTAEAQRLDGRGTRFVVRIPE